MIKKMTDIVQQDITKESPKLHTPDTSTNTAAKPLPGIFAADLDRTLIFSEQSADYPCACMETTEYKENRALTYMHPKAARLLHKLQDAGHLFIPVTMRTEPLYQRIAHTTITRAPHAVIAGGATAILDGKTDIGWEAYVQGTMKARGGQDERRRLMLELSNSNFAFSIPPKSIDHVAIRAKFMQDPIDDRRFLKFQAQCRDSGWQAMLTEKKLFVYPHGITKEACLLYILTVLEQRGLVRSTKPDIAAGDRILDYNFMRHADHAIAPHKSELANSWARHKCPPNAGTTESAGAESSVEILTKALRVLE